MLNKKTVPRRTHKIITTAERNVLKSKKSRNDQAINDTTKYTEITKYTLLRAGDLSLHQL